MDDLTRKEYAALYVAMAKAYGLEDAEEGFVLEPVKVVEDKGIEPFCCSHCK